MCSRTILFALLSTASISVFAAPPLLTEEQMDSVSAAGTFASSFARANNLSTSASSEGRFQSISISRAFAGNTSFGSSGGGAVSVACCGTSTSSVNGSDYAINFNQLGLSISIGVAGLNPGLNLSAPN